MNAVPVELIQRLTTILEQAHAEAQLSAILAALGDRVSTTPQHVDADTLVPAGVVATLYRLLGRVGVESLFPAVLGAVAPYLHEPTVDEDPLPEGAGTEGLTRRELDVLTAISRGRTNAAIGRELGT
ncbi:MAG TPA: hypothetical protein VGM93_11875, partial [Acidimicrobiales bacterium]